MKHASREKEKDGEYAVMKFCRYLESEGRKVSTRSLLGRKVKFLIWKCIAIKVRKLAASEFREQRIRKFGEVYLDAQAEVRSGDNRFDCLFNEDIEDDCSGFYAIFIHYLKKLDEEGQCDVATLKKLLQRHLNEFEEAHALEAQMDEMRLDDIL